MNKLKEINGKFYQEAEVIMLVTTDKKLKIGDLGLSENNILWYIKESNFKEADVLYECKPQHLYFLSNEEIKEGDYVIDSMGELFGPYEKGDIIGKEAKKIIATTDIPLQLPQPSQSFIQAYIKAYNESKPITKVLVEMEETGVIINKKFPISIRPRFELKVNSSNEITIKKIKDSWTREELRPKFLKLCHDVADYIEKGYDEKTEFNIDNWIEENL